MTTHNCGILSKSRVDPPGNALGISLTIHSNRVSLYLPDIKQSFTVLIHLFHSTLPYIEPLSNPVILNSLHMAEPSENTFNQSFCPHHSSLCTTALSMHSGLYSPDTHQTSEVVYLYSPNPRPLILPTYHRLITIGKNRHQQWLMQDPSSLKLQTPTINQT